MYRCVSCTKLEMHWNHFALWTT